MSKILPNTTYSMYSPPNYSRWVNWSGQAATNLDPVSDRENFFEPTNLNFEDDVLGDSFSETSEVGGDLTGSFFPSLSSMTENVGSLFAGSLMTNVNRDIINYSNSTNLLNAQKGTGPEGHAFTAPLDAAIQNNFNSRVGDIENVEILAGSAFGPEGLAGGLAAAAVTGLVSSYFEPNPSDNGVNTTTPQV